MKPMEKPRLKPGKGHRPNSLANLRPFQPANQANPHGRPPKDCSLTSLLKEKIDKLRPNDAKGRTWREALVDSWLEDAMKSPVLFKELLDRLEGKVAQPVTGDPEKPIYARVIYERCSSREASPGH